MTLSLRLNIKNNEGSLNNLYSFSCTPCYLVHYRASKRFDFHDHVSYHRKVSIDNSTLLSSAPFHVDNEAAGRSTNPVLSWSKPSAQSRQVQMKLIWNIAYLNQHVCFDHKHVLFAVYNARRSALFSLMNVNLHSDCW